MIDKLGPFKRAISSEGVGTFRAVLVPENFTASCGVRMNNVDNSAGDYYVDWGDGTPIKYSTPTSASAVPTGNVIVTSDLPANGGCDWFRINTDTFTSCAMTGCAQLTSMDSTFNTRSKITTITMDDTSNVERWRLAFRSTTGLTSCNVTDFSGAINGPAGFQCNSAFELSALTSLGAITVTGDAARMFAESGILAINSASDFSGITEADQMFLNSDIVTFPDMDMTDCINFDSMFRGSADLETVGALLTGEAADSVDYDAMFLNCTSLTTIDAIDTTNTSSTSVSMFGNCPLLTAPNSTEQADLADFNGADYN